MPKEKLQRHLHTMHHSSGICSRLQLNGSAILPLDALLLEFFFGFFRPRSARRGDKGGGNHVRGPGEPTP